MPTDLQVSHGLGKIVEEVEAVALASARQQGIGDDELGEILSFLAKVSHVVEQAFRDVLAILIEIKFLRPRDLSSNKVHDLRRKTELVLARSRYRDAEEICSRLGHLKEIYQRDLARLIDPLTSRNEWKGLFGLIEEREGRIIMLIQDVMRAIERRLGSVKEQELPELTRFAAEQAEAIKSELNALSTFTNQILGLSGKRGFLEMIKDRNARSAVVREMSVLINQGHVDMSRTYSMGQGVLLAENASAKDITVNQVWRVQDIDLSKLATELAQLREQMKAEASAAEHDVSVGHVAIAEKAAQEGDQNGTLDALKRVGSWALSVAEKIGVGVATQAIKTALGI